VLFRSMVLSDSALIHSVVNGDEVMTMHGGDVPWSGTAVLVQNGVVCRTVVWEYAQQLESGKTMQWGFRVTNPHVGTLMVNTHTDFDGARFDAEVPISSLTITDQGTKGQTEYVPSKSNPIIVDITKCVAYPFMEPSPSTCRYWLEGTVKGTYYNKVNPKDTVTIDVAFKCI